MAAALGKIYQFLPVLIYDGTNGADLCASWNSNPYLGHTIANNGCTATLVSDNGVNCVINFTQINGIPGNNATITLIVGNTIFLTQSPLDPINKWNELAWSYSELPDAGSGGIVAGAVKYGGFGQSLIGALAVGSQNITVTIRPTQPDTSYIATAFLDGPALALGTVSVGAATILSTSSVRVPVTNSGLLPVTLSSSTVSVNVTSPQS